MASEARRPCMEVGWQHRAVQGVQTRPGALLCTSAPDHNPLHQGLSSRPAETPSVSPKGGKISPEERGYIPQNYDVFPMRVALGFPLEK